MERVREQARVQVAGRSQEKLVHELLKIEPDTGFCRLPEPNSGDMFVDLEGDPFAGDLEASGGRNICSALLRRKLVARAFTKSDGRSMRKKRNPDSSGWSTT
jgi:hypothetical protein